MNIKDKVRHTITEYGLIEKGDRVLVALSGGSDSVAMLHILKDLSEIMDFTVCAAHLNHNIRKEALHDEMFVKNLCESMGIECYTRSVNLPEYAKKKAISSELAGREVRYAFFEELRKEKNIDKIATAHNKNDSAESILLHLIRGCGIDGMCGISPKRNGYIIRPVINLTKKEIEDYCHENGFKYVVDKTNFETDYTRNKIRLLLLPLIEKEINPNFTSILTENANIFNETAVFLENYSKKVYNIVCDNNIADIHELFKEDIAVVRCVIQKMFCIYTNKAEKLPIKYVNAIIDIIKSGANSKTVNLPGGISARIEYKKLYFKNTEEKKSEFEHNIDIGEACYVSESDIMLIIKKEDNEGKDTKNKIYFSADKNSEFVVRNRRNGDVFFPVGMTGKKKLSDLFCDMKLPQSERDGVPLLICNNELVWVVGIRKDRRFNVGENIYSCEIIKRRTD